MRVCLIVLISLMVACSSLEQITSEKTSIPNHKASSGLLLENALFCSNEWFHYVEGQLHTGDRQGHGPDLGSTEWQSVVEFKLNLNKQLPLPEKSTLQWCEYIQKQLDERRKIPSFSCQAQNLNSIEKTICAESKLIKLDAQLNTIFTAAIAQTVVTKLYTEHKQHLKAEQRGWIKGRDDCWKSDSLVACIQDAYQYRIAELQTRYDLIDGLAPIFYVCDGALEDEITVKFYPTEPPSLMAERGADTSFMILKESASGAKYQGKNESFWEHHGHAIVVWGIDSQEMHCEKMH